MPGGDGTGPLGMGPLSGRGMGYCAGYGVPGFWNTPTRFMGWSSRLFRMPFMGRAGGGRGWRNMFYATGLPGWLRFGNPAAFSAVAGQMPMPNSEMEKQVLGAQLDYLQRTADEVRKRLAELDNQNITS